MYCLFKSPWNIGQLKQSAKSRLPFFSLSSSKFVLPAISQVWLAFGRWLATVFKPVALMNGHLTKIKLASNSNKQVFKQNTYVNFSAKKKSWYLVNIRICHRVSSCHSWEHIVEQRYDFLSEHPSWHAPYQEQPEYVSWLVCLELSPLLMIDEHKKLIQLLPPTYC